MNCSPSSHKTDCWQFQTSKRRLTSKRLFKMKAMFELTTRHPLNRCSGSNPKSYSLTTASSLLVHSFSRPQNRLAALEVRGCCLGWLEAVTEQQHAGGIGLRTLTKHSPGWDRLSVQPKGHLRQDHGHYARKVGLDDEVPDLPLQMEMGRHDCVFTCKEAY